MKDYPNVFTNDCKYMLVGKFTSVMPKIYLIRKSFISQTQLSGGVNIAHDNQRHVIIGLNNELYFNTVWTQHMMTIEGTDMRLKKGVTKVQRE